MPYITREDGEHFVIPSYRDVLTAKQKNTLKKDILLLSQSYGEYITFQRKGTTQYEVAFSPDTGYLLGESIWHFLKRPIDMVYCEAIPNTTEAILVIVKNSSVYLDGRFPLDSIPEELVIFLTQQNHFEVYIHGDVPISENHEDAKFSFDPSSVAAFHVLDKPIFPTLPLYKNYQLLLVDLVLKANNIGVFPTKQVVLAIVALGLAWMMYSFITSENPQVEQTKVNEVNPYQTYNELLRVPDAALLIQQSLAYFNQFSSMPGWSVATFGYDNGVISAQVQSSGGSINDLITWAKQQGFTTDIRQNGVYLTRNVDLPDRGVPKYIYSTKNVLANVNDNIVMMYPGNHLRLGEIQKKGVYVVTPVTFAFSDITTVRLNLIAEKLKDLPIVLQTMSFTVKNGIINGSILFDALGS